MKMIASNQTYSTPQIRIVEVKTEGLFCESPMALGTTSTEGYTEEDFEW